MEFKIIGYNQLNKTYHNENDSGVTIKNVLGVEIKEYVEVIANGEKIKKTAMGLKLDDDGKKMVNDIMNKMGNNRLAIILDGKIIWKGENIGEFKNDSVFANIDEVIIRSIKDNL